MCKHLLIVHWQQLEIGGVTNEVVAAVVINLWYAGVLLLSVKVRQKGLVRSEVDVKLRSKRIDERR